LQLVQVYASQILLVQSALSASEVPNWHLSAVVPCAALSASVSNLVQALYVVVSAMVVVAQQRSAVHLEVAVHAVLQSASRVAAVAEVVPIRAISVVDLMRVSLSFNL